MGEEGNSVSLGVYSTVVQSCSILWLLVAPILPHIGSVFK